MVDLLKLFVDLPAKRECTLSTGKVEHVVHVQDDKGKSTLLTLIRLTKDEKVLAIFKGLLL